MAKIKNAKPKSTSGGYERLVGNPAMADIFTKAQSTVISNGTELEKMIRDRAQLIANLDEFIDQCDEGLVPDGSYLCTKAVLKESKYNLEKHEPDFIAFTLNTTKKLCYVVELKDGDAFDTKKAAAEKEMLQKFVNHLAPRIPFRTKYYICCFNQLDKAKIVAGFKNTVTIEEVMSGNEFCNILGINYRQIVEFRKDDAVENYAYVVQKMSEIPDIQNAVVSEHRTHISEDEFYVDDDADLAEE
jgi:hypothetical protein